MARNIDLKNTQKSEIFGATKSKEKKHDFEGIESEAKQVLDKFAKALEKVEKEKTGDIDFFVDRYEFERKEEAGNEPDPEFKKRILNNSPKHDDDFVIAEKGSWK